MNKSQDFLYWPAGHGLPSRMLVANQHHFWIMICISLLTTKMLDIVNLRNQRAIKIYLSINYRYVQPEELQVAINMHSVMSSDWLHMVRSNGQRKWSRSHPNSLNILFMFYSPCGSTPRVCLCQHVSQHFFSLLSPLAPPESGQVDR